MEITRDLKLVFPVDTAKHGRAHVYSLPLARVIFEQFCLELGATYSKVFGGYDPRHVAMTAPQLAYPVLKQTAIKLGTWDGPAGVQNGLINEISRLTQVAYAGENGWEKIPLELALKREILDEDSHAEVISSLCFFFLACRVGPKTLMEHSLLAAGSPRDWQATSLGFSEYLSSLPTSTPEKPTTKKRSSVIS